MLVSWRVTVTKINGCRPAYVTTVFASICISTVLPVISLSALAACVRRPVSESPCLFWLQCCFFRVAVVHGCDLCLPLWFSIFLKKDSKPVWVLVAILPWHFDLHIYISRLVPLLLLACCGLLVQRSGVLIRLSPQLSPFWSRCCLARCLLVTPDKHSMFKQWLLGLFGLFGVYGVILVNIFLPSGHIPRNVIYSQKKVHQVGCSNLQHDSFPNTWTSRAKSYWKKRLKHTKTASTTNVRLLYIWTSCLLSSAWSMRRPVMLPVTMIFSDSSWGDYIVALVSVSQCVPFPRRKHYILDKLRSLRSQAFCQKTLPKDFCCKLIVMQISVGSQPLNVLNQKHQLFQSLNRSHFGSSLQKRSCSCPPVQSRCCAVVFPSIRIGTLS